MYVVEFNYTKMNEMMAVKKKFNCSILQKDMELFCKFKTGIPGSTITENLHNFSEIAGIEISAIENI